MRLHAEPERLHELALPKDREADARLIAAAPELLAIVKAWLDEEPGRIAFGALVQRTRAVIAAAEGTP